MWYPNCYTEINILSREMYWKRNYSATGFDFPVLYAAAVIGLVVLSRICFGLSHTTVAN